MIFNIRIKTKLKSRFRFFSEKIYILRGQGVEPNLEKNYIFLLRLPLIVLNIDSTSRLVSDFKKASP